MSKQENLKRGSSKLKTGSESLTPVPNPAFQEIMNMEYDISRAYAEKRKLLAEESQQLNQKRDDLFTKFCAIPVVTVDGIPAGTDDIYNHSAYDAPIDFSLQKYRQEYPSLYAEIENYVKLHQRRTAINLELQYQDGFLPDMAPINAQTMKMFDKINQSFKIDIEKINVLVTQYKQTMFIAMSSNNMALTALNLDFVTDKKFQEFTESVTWSYVQTMEKSYPQIKNQVTAVVTNGARMGDNYAFWHDKKISFTRKFFSGPRDLNFVAEAIAHEVTHILQDYNLTTIPQILMDIERKYHAMYNVRVPYSERIHEREALLVGRLVGKNYEKEFENFLIDRSRDK